MQSSATGLFVVTSSPDVTGKTLKDAIKRVVDPRARIMTDEYVGYKGLGPSFEGGHNSIRHRKGQYAKGDITTNTIESSFALVKRGIIGTYHNVSAEVSAPLSVAVRRLSGMGVN